MAIKHDSGNERRSSARERVRPDSQGSPEDSSQAKEEKKTSTWAPVVAGVMLDVVDLITWGPLGIRIGLLIGALAGWLLAPALGFEGRQRWLGALGAGLYCMLPFTAILPLGSLVGFAMRLRESRTPEPAQSVSGSPEAPSIEAEYTARWDDPPEK